MLLCLLANCPVHHCFLLTPINDLSIVRTVPLNVFSTFVFVVWVYCPYDKTGVKLWLITCVMNEAGKYSSLYVQLNHPNAHQASCIILLNLLVVSLLRAIFLPKLGVIIYNLNVSCAVVGVFEPCCSPLPVLTYSLCSS